MSLLYLRDDSRHFSDQLRAGFVLSGAINGAALTMQKAMKQLERLQENTPNINLARAA